MIAGLEEISRGDVVIGDRRVNDVPPKDRDIAMVFQNYALYPHMSVYENMAFGLKLRKYPKDEIRKRVTDAAEILGITDYLERKPKALSGGQRQRVAVGRAIVRQPSVFLFDEPLSNLDAKMRVQMRSEITKLHRRLQSTMIYVTHDQVEALTFAQEVVVMTRGRAVQVGSAEALFERPAHTFVGHFIGSPGMNFLPAVCTQQALQIGSATLALPAPLAQQLAGTRSLKLGVRPEYISVHAQPVPGSLPAKVLRWQDLGTSGLLTTECDAGVVRVRLAGTVASQWQVGETVHVQVMGTHSCFYENEEWIA
jgi:multiple sugar transport system ATP-binding protein